jgi:hypothetical protein
LHDDPVTVTDNLTGLASAPIVSIVPVAGAKPFPCSPPPTQIPFTCSGHMRLEINERHKYTMTVKLPANAPAGGALKNCATVTSPAGTKSEVDCHEVKLASACPPKRPVGTPPNCCPKGMTYKDGACRCPEGMQLSRRGVCIAIPKAPEKCPAKRPVGTPPNCCPKGMTYKNGACRCPEGMQLSRRGVCMAIPKAPEKCPPNRPVGTPPYCCPQNSVYKNGACVCPSGTVGVPPFCAKQREQEPQRTCPRGMIGIPPNCNCPEGTQWSRRHQRCRAVETTPSQPRPETPPSQPKPEVCQPYGQTCRSARDCCNNVPCSGGLCRYN